MENSFSRIITLLRKEHKLSQKQVASDLNISQALLSHYEKGVRECGLDFVLKIADYYDVSCDYLLGRAPEPNGSRININDIPDNACSLPSLNKKLIFNSLNIIFDLLPKVNNKAITTEISNYLMLSIYKMFRVLYSINDKNPQHFFKVPAEVERPLSCAAQLICEANAYCIANSKNLPFVQNIPDDTDLPLSPEIIADNYPSLASSLYNLIHIAESKINEK